MVNEVFNYADYLKDKQQVEAEAKPSPKPSQKPSQPSSNPAPENPAEKPAKKPSVLTKNTGWESSVKKIASDKSKSKTEKYEAVMKLVNKNVMKQDAGDFFLEMVQDYSTQKYLSKPKNDVYMLEQIYKSGILNKQGDMLTEGGVMTRELLPMYQFSFDYWQNVKYVYRGVDKIDSEAVLSNETQMFKSLLEAGNLNQ